MNKWIKILGMSVLACIFSFSAKTGADAAQVVDVQQTEGNESSIAIQWSPVLGADSYQYTISDGTTPVSETTMLTSTAIAGLAPGASYTVTVIALQNGTEISEASEPLEVITAPDMSKFVAAQSDAAKKTATITMSGAAGANYYEVRTSDSKNKKIAEGSKESLKIKNLSSNKKYTYHVYAARQSASGFTAYSTVSSYKTVTVKTLGGAIKTSNFDVGDVKFDEDIYYIKVKGSYQADGYQIQFRTMTNQTKKTILNEGFDEAEVEGVINGHFYKYRIRTYIACGEKNVYSAWSGYNYIGIAKTASATFGPGGIQLKWGNVTDATKFIVYASTKETSGFRQVASVSGSKHSIKFTRVNGMRIRRGRKYYIQIRAVSKDGSKEIRSEFVNTVNGSFH